MRLSRKIEATSRAPPIRSAAIASVDRSSKLVAKVTYRSSHEWNFEKRPQERRGDQYYASSGCPDKLNIDDDCIEESISVAVWRGRRGRRPRRLGSLIDHLFLIVLNIISLAPECNCLDNQDMLDAPSRGGRGEFEAPLRPSCVVLLHEATPRSAGRNFALGRRSAHARAIQPGEDCTVDFRGSFRRAVDFLERLLIDGKRVDAHPKRRGSWRARPGDGLCHHWPRDRPVGHRQHGHLGGLRSRPCKPGRAIAPGLGLRTGRRRGLWLDQWLAGGLRRNSRDIRDPRFWNLHVSDSGASI